MLNKTDLFGLGFIFLAGIFCSVIANNRYLSQFSISELTLALAAGFVINNLFNLNLDKLASSIEFSKTKLLRLGIILYGFKLNADLLMQVGVGGVAIAILVLITTFLLAYIIGVYILKLDRETSILIGAGSSICGAAAIMATKPVIAARVESVSVAICSVIVFGNLALILYPIFEPLFDFNDFEYGIYIGSTVHEVAQVVALGDTSGRVTVDIAVIEKMLRVIMLAPFLVFLSVCQLKQNKHKLSLKNVNIPWFAVLFILACIVNSYTALPPNIHNIIIEIDKQILTMAMFSLGLSTHIAAIKQAGFKPIVLAGILFIYLCLGGYFINKLVLAS